MKQINIYILAFLFATLQTFAQTYTYDNLNRLTKVVYDNGTTITYSFDALGNRTSKKVTGATAPKESYAWLSSDGKTLTFCYDNEREDREEDTFDLNTGKNYPGWNPDPWSTVSSVTKVVFEPSFAEVKPTCMYVWFCNFQNLKEITGLDYLDTSEVTDMYSTFRDCWSLETLDLSHFDTSSVTDMGYMFAYCKNMISLDVSGFETSNVDDMQGMFMSCCNLTNIDVSSFNTSKVRRFSYMFEYCSSLTSLDVSNFDTSNLGYSYAMIGSCSSLRSLDISSTMVNINDEACIGTGSSTNPCIINAPEGFDFGVDTSGSYFEWKSGYFKLGNAKEAYAWLSSDGKTLTFCYDNIREERVGETYELNSGYKFPDWNPNPGDNPRGITSVVFEPSFVNVKPTNTYYWFSCFRDLTNLTGMKYLNMSAVTNMRGMFSGCQVLKSLDLSSFDTSRVTDMSWLFNGCSSLESINLNSFDTSNVTHMIGTFDGCSSLTSLDLSHFNTSKVIYFSQMFCSCSSLTSLDLSHFDTSSAIYMSSMFDFCTSLTYLDVSSFNTSKVEYMDQMFWACQGLKSLDVSHFDTRSVKSIRGMFNACRNLQSLDVRNFCISNETESGTLFRACYSLETLMLSSTMYNIGDDACERVGSYDSPCTIIAPRGFDFGVDTSGSYFVWKGGYFKLSDIPTDIETLSNLPVSEKLDVYSLNGLQLYESATPEQVKHLPKGVYIMNGKKVVVK